MNDSHGIHVIDTGFVRPRLDAAYLIVEKGRGAFVDCGVNHSVPRLLAALADAGLAPADVIAELERREGTSGIEEKALRKATGRASEEGGGQ